MRTNKFKTTKTAVETICKTFKSFEEIVKQTKEYFTHITDENSPRKEEFDNTYDVVTLANSKSKKGLTITLDNGEKLCVEYYFYNNDPDVIIIILDLMEKWKNTWIEKTLEIFVNER